MKNNWYILLYHDVSWEENPYVRGIGGTCPPDIFREHLTHLSKVGEIVSISEGLFRLASDNITSPIFSFWFDDGLMGPRKYAMPLLQRDNKTAAVSLCSRFINRSEFYWRYKLSYLSYVDGLRFLRTRLRRYGYKQPMSIKKFCISSFSELIVKEIDGVFRNFTSEDERKDAFRLFETDKGLSELRENNWAMGNHTAAHYPIGEDVFVDNFESQFDECERMFKEVLNEESQFWVLPFGDVGPRASEIVKGFKLRNDNKYLVLVGNRTNNKSNIEDRIIYRIAIPICQGHDLLKFLGRF